MKQEENRQMDNLKSEYESIPVPKEAKERMLAGIAQAKDVYKRQMLSRLIHKRRSKDHSLVLACVTIMGVAGICTSLSLIHI